MEYDVVGKKPLRNPNISHIRTSNHDTTPVQVRVMYGLYSILVRVRVVCSVLARVRVVGLGLGLGLGLEVGLHYKHGVVKMAHKRLKLAHLM